VHSQEHTFPQALRRAHVPSIPLALAIGVRKLFIIGTGGSSLKLSIFTLGTIFVLVASRLGYAQLPTESDPPKPQCDSYSMQTLPTDGFGFHQRACYWASQLFTGSALIGASFFGAISEWKHVPPEWPQGAQGFGEQMGTRYAQGMTKSTAAFIVSTITREDPRILPPSPVANESNHFGCRPSPTFKGRLGQSLVRVVWDACQSQPWHRPRTSFLLGSFASGFESLAWAPPSEDNISSALESSGSAFGGYEIDSVFAEFEPNIFGLLGKLFPTGKPK
jgi:hypothetical protein